MESGVTLERIRERLLHLRTATNRQHQQHDAILGRRQAIHQLGRVARSSPLPTGVRVMPRRPLKYAMCDQQHIALCSGECGRTARQCRALPHVHQHVGSTLQATPQSRHRRKRAGPEG